MSPNCFLSFRKWKLSSVHVNKLLDILCFAVYFWQEIPGKLKSRITSSSYILSVLVISSCFGGLHQIPKTLVLPSFSSLTLLRHTHYTSATLSLLDLRENVHIFDIHTDILLFPVPLLPKLNGNCQALPHEAFVIQNNPTEPTPASSSSVTASIYAVLYSQMRLCPSLSFITASCKTLVETKFCCQNMTKKESL